MRFLIFFLAASFLRGQSTDWPAAMKRDIAAMDQWIRTYYAGAVDPENPGFEKNWSLALRLAEERAARANTEAGYRYAVRALATSLRDGNVAVNFSTPLSGLKWAGAGVELRGERYYLRQLAGADLDFPDGAMLISCDGRAVSEFARERLDLFVTNWEIPARRTVSTPEFLLDGGNPFAPLPHSCEYRREPSIAILKLEWQDVTAAQAAAAFQPFRRVIAGRNQFKLEYKGDGAAWISVPNLNKSAAITKLIQDVQAQRVRLGSAPYIVVDVRGNAGGSSEYGDLLAQAIWGEGSLRPGTPQVRPKSWRANPAILEILREVRSKNAGLFDRLIPRMERAIAEHKPFVAEEEGQKAIGPPLREPRPAPPVFILTDGGCSHSCVLMVNLFRRMGALQAGDATDRLAIYGESAFVRELPSGKARLSIPLAYFGFRTEDLGGGLPNLPWVGAADDESGIERMIRERAAKSRSLSGTP